MSKDIPIERISDAAPFGSEVIDFGDVRIRHGMARYSAKPCEHKSLTYSTTERRVWCADCETTVENFDALMTVVHHFEAMARDVRRKSEAAEAAKTQVIHRIAAREVEKAWSGRTMAIMCPHCRGGILPEDWATGGPGRMSREYEMARRAKAKKTMTALPDLYADLRRACEAGGWTAGMGAGAWDFIDRRDDLMAALLREWKTADLTEDLAAKLRADRFLVVTEAVLREQTLQRADILAMRRKLSDGPMLIVEIKTSRADLLGDLRREKWRGYLNDGAVVFAFPAGLGDPSEIPVEAGVIVRIAQGWSWRRAPRWKDAPLPSSYLYRRMALCASDQAARRADALLRPRSADLWHAAKADRQKNGRMLAEIAKDVELWRKIVEDEKEKYRRIKAIERRLDARCFELERSIRATERRSAA